MIIVPLFWSAIFILFIPFMPDWSVLAASFLLIAVSAFCVLTINKRWVNIPCTMEITGDYFHLRLEKKSPFYKYREIKTGWEQVINFNAGEVSSTYFMVFKLLMPQAKFSLSPDLNRLDGKKVFDSFLSDVNDKVNSYNQQAVEKHLHVITDKSIFESAGARVGAVVFTVLLIAVTVGLRIKGKDWENYEWWRMVWLWVVAVPLLAPVFLSWGKRS